MLWKSIPVDGVLAFWLAYIMTRPLGASTGDWLSQQGNQGLNLGTTTTSYLFLGTIVALVIYLQIRKPGVTPAQLVNADAAPHPDLPYPHHTASGVLEPPDTDSSSAVSGLAGRWCPAGQAVHLRSPTW